METHWYVYIMQCRDRTLYTGITTDIARRLREHNSDTNGARYTRSRRPVCLLYSEPHPDRASASRREAQIKQMRRGKKLQLMRSDAAHRLPV